MRHPRYHTLAQDIFTRSDYVARAQHCIDTNALLLTQVADVAAASFGVNAPEQRDNWAPCDATSAEKVVSTLRQVVREWSTEGAAEREVCYGRVIAEICRLFPDVDAVADSDGVVSDKRPRNSVRVVVPGCGLGRLPLELAVRGFAAQGNEFSFHMLFMSNYMLNCTLRPHEFAIYPYVHAQSHQRSRDLQLRAVRVPDVHPGQLMAYRDQYHPDSPSGELSMVLGSFDDIYLKQNFTATTDPTNGYNNNEQGQFETADVVATVFFIDTAPNIFRTLDAISGLLESGGYWINFGPLLWHYEDVQADDEPNDDSDDDRTRGLELTLEEVLELIPQYGFVLEKHESGIPCTYTMDEASMGGFVYKCEFWVARKL